MPYKLDKAEGKAIGLETRDEIVKSRGRVTLLRKGDKYYVEVVTDSKSYGLPAFVTVETEEISVANAELIGKARFRGDNPFVFEEQDRLYYEVIAFPVVIEMKLWIRDRWTAPPAPHDIIIHRIDFYKIYENDVKWEQRVISKQPYRYDP